MEQCVICGSKDIEQETVTHRAEEFGIDSVYFLNTPVARCRSCGDEAITIPRYGKVVRLIRDKLCSLDRVVTGGEFALLRRELGLTAAEVARRLGYSSVSISRWEQGHIAVNQAADRSLRTWTLIALGHKWPDINNLLNLLPEEGIERVEIDLATGSDGEFWIETNYRFGGASTRSGELTVY